jgi:hypothetical protein
MAVGVIPWSSIVNWADFHGLREPDNIDILIRYIREMEDVASIHAKKKENKNGR